MPRVRFMHASSCKRGIIPIATVFIAAIAEKGAYQIVGKWNVAQSIWVCFVTGRGS